MDDEGDLTEVGSMVAEFPLDPQLSIVLMNASKKYSCAEQMLSIVSVLTASASLFMRPKDKQKEADLAKNRFAHQDGDHLTYLNVYHAYKQMEVSGDYNALRQFVYDNFLNDRALKSAESVRSQLSRILERLNLKVNTTSFNDPQYYTNMRTFPKTKQKIRFPMLYGRVGDSTLRQRVQNSPLESIRNAEYALSSHGFRRLLSQPRYRGSVRFWICFFLRAFSQFNCFLSL